MVVVLVAAAATLLGLALFGGVVSGILGTSDATDDRFIDRTIGPVMLALLVGLPLVYSIALEALPSQATVGKLAMGLKVTDLDGNRLGWGRSTGRTLAKLVSALPAGLGFVPAAATERRQALHDMIAGTVVVRSRRKAPETGRL